MCHILFAVQKSDIGGILRIFWGGINNYTPNGVGKVLTNMAIKSTFYW